MHCVPLSKAVSSEEFGGKAANLARVAAAGERVPETLALGRTALTSALKASGLPALVREYFGCFGSEKSAQLNSRHQRLAEVLRSAGLPREVGTSVREAAKPLLANAPQGIAVRSSAVYEDSPTASFAGVFESFVGITNLDEVEHRILDCWVASWSPRAIRYLLRMEVEPLADGMAVLLQTMVPATAAGVVYTADPDSGNPWRFSVRSVRGLAVDLMSGTGIGDRFEATWDTGTIESRELVGEPSLDDRQLASVCAAAQRLDDKFGIRIDVEFAFVEEELFIVQARPLTALPPVANTLDEIPSRSSFRIRLCAR